MDDVMDDVRLAIKQIEGGDEAAKEPDTVEGAEAQQVEAEQDDKGTPEAAKEPDAPEAVEPAKPAYEAPQGWGASVKEKWAALPPEVQAEIVKREQDMHHAMTRHDGDLNLGRTFKETVTPYMATFQAEGITPQQAVANVLNNDHILRFGTPQQKVQKAAELLQYYGIAPEALSDVAAYAPQPTEYIMQLQSEIAQLKQQLNPQALMQQLQQQQEDTAFKKEIEAFASDPANVYFNQLRETVAALVGQGRGLKEAYDMACYADPTIRSTLLAKEQAEREAKRKAEIAAKKHAAASVTGSPAITSNAGSQKTNKYTDPADDLREAFAAARSQI